MSEIVLKQNEDGTFSQYEPYATIDCQTKEDFDILQKALEKQRPKKPSVEGEGEWNGQIVYDTWICPECEKHYEIDYDQYDYCPNCGQHIDRSDLE